jgi:putative ABC transport system permease protein
VSGPVGLLLASIGLYGVVAFSVEQRRREISIRTALGAQRGNIVALVLRESLAVTAAGSLIGLALSVFLLRVASSLVGPVPNADAVTFIAVPLFIATVILVASYLRARRAVQVDPMVGLREEQ